MRPCRPPDRGCPSRGGCPLARRWHLTGWRARLRASGQSDDAGQLLLLVFAYVGIAAALIGVVVDVSAVFLAQRSLAATADGAALAAAQTVDESRLYGAGVDLAQLPLTPAGVSASAQQYLADDGLTRRFPEVGWEAGTDGVTAAVTLRAQLPLPFSGGLLRARGPAEVTATGRARAPYR